MTQEKKLLKLIEQGKKITEFLQSLISFPSLTGNELEIQQFIRKKLEEMKLKIDMWEPDIEELKNSCLYINR